MDIKRLRAGTRIQMLEDEDGYWAMGDKAVLSTDSCFHVDGTLHDSGGDYWANFHDQGNAYVADYKVLCIGKPECFRVLKY